ncbi:glycoside hydrolase family 16 protein [Marmoricola sp. URHB0036]|uniref:glycoside hydrolase family 16 protein n=1 Tax=Marmoricola sp. URHB0036 TaxID=1298863 RepID=UPI0004205E68|nr:glycoside hydrolase family 16 protein [Marmoricola sp. URHB0036]
MKSRPLVSVLALTILSVVLVGLTQPTASAAAFAARVSRPVPVVGEVVTVAGAVPPAKRTVVLQKLLGGRWVRVKAARTALYGRYTFAVRATATNTPYRVVAPLVKIKKRKYPARSSNVVHVTGVRPSLTFGAPVRDAYTGSTIASATALFVPARPGTPVDLYRLTNGAWTKVATAKQSSAGVATFAPAPDSSGSPETFRVVAAPGSGAANLVSGSSQSSSVSSSFGDEFTDPTSSTNWATRTQLPGGLRTCAQTDPDMVTFGNGTVTLRAEKQAVNPTTTSCPNGFWHNGMIGTAGATPSRTFGPYGYYAARVLFQKAAGSHGSFWMQAAGADAANGVEIDVAEYFGDGRTDGGLSNFVHATTGSSTATSGGIQTTAKSALGAGRTPSNGWHVYSVQWSPAGYVFRVDGIPTFSTAQPRVASGTEELVLSLLTSDYELKAMKSSSTSMSVDWVHTWG